MSSPRKHSDDKSASGGSSKGGASKQSSRSSLGGDGGSRQGRGSRPPSSSRYGMSGQNLHSTVKSLSGVHYDISSVKAVTLSLLLTVNIKFWISAEVQCHSLIDYRLPSSSSADSALKSPQKGSKKPLQKETSSGAKGSDPHTPSGPPYEKKKPLTKAERRELQVQISSQPIYM